MSTIASPREHSVQGRRIPLISTPTASSRNSLDLPPSARSASVSPSRAPPQPKRNRAALREYYNLKNTLPQPPPATTTTNSSSSQDAPSEASSIHDFSFSDVADSPMDDAHFNGDHYVKEVLERESLEGLLRIYNGVLGDIRSLDAERKGLVYDNYSKLIVATETIGRMRVEMGKEGGQGEKGLGRELGEVYERAERVRGEVRRVLDGEREWNEGESRKRNAVRAVLEVPERVRGLVAEGKDDEAKQLWGRALKVLERWKERGVGGEDVVDCIEDGEAALRGEPASEKSWSNAKENPESNP